MSLKVKITGVMETGSGFVVNFEGYDNETLILKTSLHFSEEMTSTEVLRICQDEVERASSPKPETPDLSALIDQIQEIDPERYHPLYGVNEPLKAKAIVSRLIAEKMQILIQESGLIDSYPSAERDTWERQINESLGLLAHGQESAFLTTVAASDETPQDLAQAIVDNSNGFIQAAAPLFKEKHKLIKDLGALPENVADIKVFFDSKVTPWSL